MRVAVLGAGGFIGGHTLRGLRAAGAAARAVVRNPNFSPKDPDRRIADACDVYALPGWWPERSPASTTRWR